MQEAKDRQSEVEELGLPTPQHSSRRMQRIGSASARFSHLSSAIDVDGFYTQQRVDAMLQRMHKEQEGQPLEPEPDPCTDRHAGIAYLVDRLGGREEAAIVIQRAYRAYRKHKAKVQLRRILRKCTSTIVEHYVPDRFYTSRSRNNHLKSYSIKSVDHVEGIEEEDEVATELEPPARSAEGLSLARKPTFGRTLEPLEPLSPVKPKDARSLMRCGSGRSLPPYNRPGRDLYHLDRSTPTIHPPSPQDALPTVAAPATPAPGPSLLRSPSQRGSPLLPSISSGHALDHLLNQPPPPDVERRHRSGLHALTVSDPGWAEPPSAGAAAGLAAWESASPRVLPSLSSPGHHSQDRATDRHSQAGIRPEASDYTARPPATHGRSTGRTEAVSSPTPSSPALLRGEPSGRTASCVAGVEGPLPPGSSTHPCLNALAGFEGLHSSSSPRSPRSPSTSGLHDAGGPAHLAPAHLAPAHLAPAHLAPAHLAPAHLAHPRHTAAASSQHQRMASFLTSPGLAALEPMAESSVSSFTAPQGRAAAASEAAAATMPAPRSAVEGELVGRCHSTGMLDALALAFRGGGAGAPSQGLLDGHTRQVIHSVPMGPAAVGSAMRPPAKPAAQGMAPRLNSPVGSWMGAKQGSGGGGGSGSSSGGGAGQRPGYGPAPGSPVEGASPRRAKKQGSTSLASKLFQEWKDQKRSSSPAGDPEGPAEEASQMMDEPSKDESFLNYVQRRMAAQGPVKLRALNEQR